ncbi:MAG: B3/4 domain-containing protein [Candidatus Bathyarchaeia archaeon]
MRYLRIDTALSEKFPGLSAQLLRLENLHIKRRNQGLEELKEAVYSRIRERWSLDDLSSLPIFRAYRDFFWELGIDPTKTRPASEALIRRVLHGNRIPQINTLVDAYNLASMETAIPLAAFDQEMIQGELYMRGSKQGEAFLGIGMSEPIILEVDEIVVQDNDTLVAVYPYRDADKSKISTSTQKAVVMVCGVPGVSSGRLMEAGKVAVDYITRFCNGVVA